MTAEVMRCITGDTGVGTERIFIKAKEEKGDWLKILT